MSILGLSLIFTVPAYAELNTSNDVFIKQYLPDFIMFFGNSTADALEVKLFHPDGNFTISEIAVNKDGLFSSSFYLFSDFEVGEYTITLNDTKPHEATFVIENFVINSNDTGVTLDEIIIDISNEIPENELSCILCDEGTVTKIIDGDTIDIDGERVRLALVNTPERGQPGFVEATIFTATLCPIGTIANFDQDSGQLGGSYGRLIGEVWCGGKSLNAELIFNGHADIYGNFCGTSEFSKKSWAKTCISDVDYTNSFSGFNATSIEELLAGFNTTSTVDSVSKLNMSGLQKVLSKIDPELLPPQNISSYLPKYDITSDEIPNIKRTDLDGKIFEGDTAPRSNPFNSKEFIFSEIHLMGIVAVAIILILAQKFRKK